MGFSTTGSSEAALLGGLALKCQWLVKMTQPEKSTDKPIIVSAR